MNGDERHAIERECERLVAQYCHYVDHGEAAKIADLFSEDGRWWNVAASWDGQSAALSERGYGTLALHGDLTQNNRNSIMDSFSRGKAQLLVTTDIASGPATIVFLGEFPIEMEKVSLVFQQDGAP